MDKQVEYSVRTVTVFADRARVMCLGEVTLDSNVSSLLFDKLPLTVDADSLRVKGKGTANVRILGVDISRQHYEHTPSPRAYELENQLDLLKDELFSLKDHYAVWDAQLEHLQGLRLATGKYAQGLSKGRSSVNDHLQLINFFREQDEQIRSEQRKLKIKSRASERQISKLERELNELQSVQPLRRFQARITIEVIESGKFWPELTYVVRQAGWQPLYDIRLVDQDNGSRLEINSLAQIFQKTGQDWEGVQLSVSTARPALNQRLPELMPWYIGEIRPPQPRSIRTTAADSEPAMVAMSAAPPNSADIESGQRDIIQADIAHADLQYTGAAVRFNVPGKWDIVSNGSPHKMFLTSFEVDPNINYLAIPKHTDAVYRRAVFNNASGGALLDGVASIFVYGEFIGKTKIKHTPLEGEFKILLGVEEQISIERELTKRSVDKRLLREKRTVQYAYKIEINNFMQKTAKLELQDQIPVSEHEQIKIKLEHSRPEPDKKNDLNLLEWHLELTPGAEFNVACEFEVEHPTAMRIRGLEA